jgi:hypothetical protein
VVLEVDALAGREIDLEDGDDLALDLAGAAAEVDAGHVAQARRLAPAGVADEVLDVERRPARPARRVAGRVLGVAPLAFEARNWTHARGLRGGGFDSYARV